jgi:signal transduction histidine kinase
MDDPGRTRQAPSRAALLLGAGTALSLVVAAVATTTGATSHDDRIGFWLVTAFRLPALVVTLLLVQRLPGHALTRTLALGAALVALGQGPEAVGRALEAKGAWHDLVAVCGDLGWLGTIGILPLLIAAFPDGWPRGRWRWAARGAALGFGTEVVVSLLRPVDALAAPLAVLAAAGGVLLLPAALLLTARLVAHAVRGHDRRAGSPFAALAVLLVAGWLAVGSLDSLVGLPGAVAGALVTGVLVAGPQLLLGYGVLRRQWFGLDVVVRRALVATAGGALVLTAYLLAAAAAGALLPGHRTTLALTAIPFALVVLGLAPLQRKGSRWLDRRLYGVRQDPEALLLALAEELAQASPEEVAGLVTRRTADGLRLPWVGVSIDREGSWVQVAEAGTRDQAVLVQVAIRHAGEQVGLLSVQPRRGEETIGAPDRLALERVAVQAAPALAAARLVDELTQSRERLVAAREQDRERLRQELHDGLSPSLAGMSLALGAARRQLGDDLPEEVRQLLDSVQTESTDAWTAVRSLLSDLQPPGLAELGLLGALEQRATQLTRPGEFVVEVVCVELPVLAPAVEEAAFRITNEAMTNAARHSGGSRCCARLTAADGLEITVTDDGSVELPVVEGVGLASVRARAAELGGRVTLEREDGGLALHVLLPLGGAA